MLATYSKGDESFSGENTNSEMFLGNALLMMDYTRGTIQLQINTNRNIHNCLNCGDYEKQEEECVVFKSNTVVEEHAMVIHAVYFFPALGAVEICPFHRLSENIAGCWNWLVDFQTFWISVGNDEPKDEDECSQSRVS